MKAQFDLDPEIIYLNAGSHSISPRVVQEAVTRYQREFERNPTMGLFTSWSKLWPVQCRLAQFLGARPQDLFLRVNVTEAMNSLILGIPLRPGSEIVSTNLEYGAVANIARFKAQSDSLKFRQIELPHEPNAYRELTEDGLVDGIVSQLRAETCLLLVSHIMTGTGLKIPLQKLARETRKRGILLAVDGAHGPGAVSLNFAELEDVDFYGGNLHKWTMAAKGTGFGWVAPRHHEAIRPIFAGWTTFETREPFDVFDHGNRFQAKMLFSSSRDFAPFFALTEMVEFWERFSSPKILARMAELQLTAEALVSEHLGWTCVSPPRKLRGPLLTYKVPRHLEAEGYGLMNRIYQESRLQIAMSPVVDQPHLRLSPHIWNDEADLEQAVKILANL